MNSDLLHKLDSHLTVPFHVAENLSDEASQDEAEAAFNDAQRILRGEPATDEQIAVAETRLGIQFSDQYKAFIQRYGGADVGTPIHAFSNALWLGDATVIELTENARAAAVGTNLAPLLATGFVFSYDVLDNPYVSLADGRIAWMDLDAAKQPNEPAAQRRYKIVADSFDEFVEKMLDEDDEDEAWEDEDN